jgi:hypothetical protein
MNFQNFDADHLGISFLSSNVFNRALSGQGSQHQLDRNTSFEARSL